MGFLQLGKQSGVGHQFRNVELWTRRMQDLDPSVDGINDSILFSFSNFRLKRMKVESFSKHSPNLLLLRIIISIRFEQRSQLRSLDSGEFAVLLGDHGHVSLVL